jgi:hypothetical protein
MLGMVTAGDGKLGADVPKDAVVLSGNVQNTAG